MTVWPLALASCKPPPQQQENPAMNTNQTIETILNRHSVRKYTGKEISPEVIETLLRAGMAAPSSRDRRPWHFVVISDKTLLQTLGDKLKNASMLKEANKAIMVCGDVELSDNCWFLDCSAASQNILLAAASMNIGAVWTAVFPYEDRAAEVNALLHLPGNIKALSIIPLGYPAEEGAPKDKSDSTKIHYNKW